jgi:S1-C subfamily serine protease
MHIRKHDDTDRPFPLNVTGLGFELRDGKIMAKIADSNSIVAKAGLRTGDVLIKVNGNHLTGDWESMVSLREEVRLPSPRIMRIEALQNGSHMPFSVCW